MSNPVWKKLTWSSHEVTLQRNPMASLVLRLELKKSTISRHSTYPPAFLISAATFWTDDSLISPRTSLALYVQRGMGDYFVFGRADKRQHTCTWHTEALSPFQCPTRRLVNCKRSDPAPN